MRARDMGGLLAGLLLTSVVAAQEAGSVLPTVAVSVTQAKPELQRIGTGPGVPHEVSTEGVALWGAAGGAQPYSAVALLPGVKSVQLDAYGMVSRIGGNKGMRVRGIAAWHGANGTVDGLTLSNINPGPGYLQMFDVENVAGVSLAQGPIAPSRAGLFTTAGALDTAILWPQAKLGGSVSGAAGSDAFARYALRADTGSMGAHDVRLAASASSTHGNLWRGPGTSQRNNALVAASTQLDAWALRVLVVQSTISQNSYRALTASQAKDLRHYRDVGWDEAPVAGSYQSFVGYNRQHFENQALIGEADYQASPDTLWRFKAFHFDEDGASLDGTMTNKVREWLIDHVGDGVSADVSTRLGGMGLDAGYSLTSMVPPGPPTAQRFYAATASGLSWTSATASSSNQGWTTLTDVTGRHEIQTLYALASQEWGAWKGAAGVRYFQERLPSLTEYNKVGVGELDPSAAIDASAGPVIAVEGGTVRKWLPWAEARYAWTPGVEGRVTVGRNLGAPSFDIWNSNFKGLPASQQARAQALWSALKPEVDDAVDIGMQVDGAQGYVAPTLYYARIRDKSVTVYDPSVGMTYGQNIGKGHLVGLEVAWGWQGWRGWSLFGSGSYTRAVFDEDLQTNSSTTLAVKGKQFPDTPQWMGTVGAQWQSEATKAGPVLRYMGGRYDDSVHTNRFGGYTVLDLNAERSWRVGRVQWVGKLSVLNVADKR